MSFYLAARQDIALANNFKGAFLQAVDEFNNYGQAVFSAKVKIDTNSALQLYGFKVSWLKLPLKFLSTNHEPVLFPEKMLGPQLTSQFRSVSLMPHGRSWRHICTCSSSRCQAQSYHIFNMFFEVVTWTYSIRYP